VPLPFSFFFSLFPFLPAPPCSIAGSSFCCTFLLLPHFFWFSTPFVSNIFSSLFFSLVFLFWIICSFQVYRSFVFYASRPFFYFFCFSQGLTPFRSAFTRRQPRPRSPDVRVSFPSSPQTKFFFGFPMLPGLFSGSAYAFGSYLPTLLRINFRHRILSPNFGYLLSDSSVATLTCAYCGASFPYTAYFYSSFMIMVLCPECSLSSAPIGPGLLYWRTTFLSNTGFWEFLFPLEFTYLRKDARILNSKAYTQTIAVCYFQLVNFQRVFLLHIFWLPD